MALWSHLRSFLLILACLGYLANGAQAHVHVPGAQTLSLKMCSTDTLTAVEIDIPGGPIEATEDTCCGACTLAVALISPEPLQRDGMRIYPQPIPFGLPNLVSPRSPLWAGAPPHGPPSRHKA